MGEGAGIGERRGAWPLNVRTNKLIDRSERCRPNESIFTGNYEAIYFQVFEPIVSAVATYEATEAIASVKFLALVKV